MRVTEVIYHRDSDGDEFEVAAIEEAISFTFVERNNIVHFTNEEVKQLINYLQNWLDTGNFEGERKEENDS